MRVLEYAFYIHGVMPESAGRSHEATYGEMHDGIAMCLHTTTWPTRKGGAEWGWETKVAKRQSHHALADAQRIFGGKVLERIKTTRDFTVNPSRLVVNGMRETMMHGFGDMFYYVSAEGKWAVRSAVAQQLTQHIKKSVPDDTHGISLTLLGHSAGSVIAFDLLYYLFMDEVQFTQRLGFEETGSGLSSSLGSDYNEFETRRVRVIKEVRRNFKYLRRLAAEQKLRLRMLVTFGSPISMLMFRSDRLVERLAAGECLTPAEYGLTSVVAGHALRDDSPRWLNIWDKDDPIAWPVSPVMGNHPLVKDEYVDVSDNVVTAHNRYWANPNVHAAIARYWRALE